MTSETKGPLSAIGVGRAGFTRGAGAAVSTTQGLNGGERPQRLRVTTRSSGARCRISRPCGGSGAVGSALA